MTGGPRRLWRECGTTRLVDQSEHYYQLVLQGRNEFLRGAAPAALVRHRGGASTAGSMRASYEDSADETLVASIEGDFGSGIGPSNDLEVYALAKKPGAPFADMITVGRTPNNDVVVNDITVSRFHAYFKLRDNEWVICDSGSKNGTFLAGVRLEKRKERTIMSGMPLRMGDVDVTFYIAEDLFEVLSGSR